MCYKGKQSVPRMLSSFHSAVASINQQIQEGNLPRVEPCTQQCFSLEELPCSREKQFGKSVELANLEWLVGKGKLQNLGNFTTRLFPANPL